MATRPVDWEELTPENPGPVTGRWAATLSGTTPTGHRRVFLDVEGERDPAPERYTATLTAEYGDAEPEVLTPFSERVSLEGRESSEGYTLRGESKEHRVDVSPFNPG